MAKAPVHPVSIEKVLEAPDSRLGEHRTSVVEETGMAVFSGVLLCFAASRLLFSSENKLIQ